MARNTKINKPEKVQKQQQNMARIQKCVPAQTTSLEFKVCSKPGESQQVGPTSNPRSLRSTVQGNKRGRRPAEIPMPMLERQIPWIPPPALTQAKNRDFPMPVLTKVIKTPIKL